MRAARLPAGVTATEDRVRDAQGGGGGAAQPDRTAGDVAEGREAAKGTAGSRGEEEGSGATAGRAGCDAGTCATGRTAEGRVERQPEVRIIRPIVNKVHSLFYSLGNIKHV